MNDAINTVEVTYTALVEKFRELARDILRMRWINNVKDEIHFLDVRLEEINDEKKRALKSIARVEYRKSQLDANDPDFDDKTKNEEYCLKQINSTIEFIDKRTVEVEENKTLLNEKITKIESGELKVSADNLSDKAKELAEAYGNQKARELKI